MTTNALDDRYASPEALVSDVQVPVQVRRKALESWAEDLTARLKASDESMTSDDPGATSDLLRRVHACMTQIDGSLEDELRDRRQA